MSVHFKNSFWMAFLAWGIVSCGNKETESPKVAASSFDLNAARNTIEQSNKTFVEALDKGDSNAVAAHYTSDAHLLPQGSPEVSGTDNIKGFWGGVYRMGLQATIQTGEVWGDDDLLTEQGTFALTDKKGQQVDKGKYVVVWKKEDGNWKMFRDIWNSDKMNP